MLVDWHRGFWLSIIFAFRQTIYCAARDVGRPRQDPLRSSTPPLLATGPQYRDLVRCCRVEPNAWHIQSRRQLAATSPGGPAVGGLTIGRHRIRERPPGPGGLSIGGCHATFSCPNFRALCQTEVTRRYVVGQARPDGLVRLSAAVDGATGPLMTVHGGWCGLRSLRFDAGSFRSGRRVVDTP